MDNEHVNKLSNLIFDLLKKYGNYIEALAIFEGPFNVLDQISIMNETVISKIVKLDNLNDIQHTRYDKAGDMLKYSLTKVRSGPFFAIYNVSNEFGFKNREFTYLDTYTEIIPKHADNDLLLSVLIDTGSDIIRTKSKEYMKLQHRLSNNNMTSLGNIKHFISELFSDIDITELTDFDMIIRVYQDKEYYNEYLNKLDRIINMTIIKQSNNDANLEEI